MQNSATRKVHGHSAINRCAQKGRIAIAQSCHMTCGSALGNPLPVLWIAFVFLCRGVLGLAVRPVWVRKLLYLFENHVLDTDRRELRRGTMPVVIEPQAFDLLVYLIQHCERVVSKDDLIATIWKGRRISESALSTCINAARKALDDDGEMQRLIRTFPRKGFRFVGAAREEKSSGRRTPDELAGHQSNPASPLPDKPSIAVLSFTNMSGDPAQDCFGDGMAEDITTALSKVRWFSVVSRNSAFAYKAKQIDIKQAARDLGVRYVLEGSVRKAGTRARVTAQLLDAVSGHHVWAERYD